ncbi:hypothetical protein [Streptomyces sp. AK02-01A]|uniref:hypothetical protein n=1 Tax=Streptomyces sp. AK02-01A TaxID=3028648 RepID=UPI0029B0C48D|nr:hypothetical protein [Streptomyces sp. AK02-01A]MDX3851899.1 hypothetical protein [Streptomyces sp. AK02-01A]
MQRRAVAGSRTARALARELSAHFVAFDVLQGDGSPVLVRPYAERRAVLESLVADPDRPWALCPMTTDPGLAHERLEEWTQVPGLEGILWWGFCIDRLTAWNRAPRRTGAASCCRTEALRREARSLACVSYLRGLPAALIPGRDIPLRRRQRAHTEASAAPCSPRSGARPPKLHGRVPLRAGQW